MQRWIRGWRGRVALSRISAVLLCGIIGLAAALIPALAQDTQKADLRALVLACRPDYQRFCSGVKPGDGAILTCLRQHQSDLSPTCLEAAQKLKSMAPADGAPATGAADSGVPDSGVPAGDLVSQSTGTATLEHMPAGTEIRRDIGYGSDPKQRFDVYLPAAAARTGALAPILVMVHGGAWAYGDKASPGVVDNKAAYWLAKGYVFISVNNRLLPGADPLLQAQDVARALAKIQRQAMDWQADVTRLVLMGHSAGAHLVTLVTVEADLTTKAGVTPWRATISLDSAAVDVSTVMQQPHASLYDKAFGADRAYWNLVSPLAQLTAKPVPTLMVCSSRRRNSCPTARTFANKAVALGGQSSALPQDLSHEEINVKLGLPGDYTDKVEAFLQSVGMP